MNGFDLGIAGRCALVCARSEGLERACATAVAQAGVAVTINGRDGAKLKSAAEEIAQETGAHVAYAQRDVTTSEGRTAVLQVCSAPDILVTNAGGPRPDAQRSWGDADWIAALEAQMFSAVLLTNAVIGNMIEQRWGRIINMTSNAVKLSMPWVVLTTGSRMALTGYSATIAREVAQYDVTVNNMLPGPHDTKRLREYSPSRGKNHGMTVEELLVERAAGNPSRRIGQPANSGPGARLSPARIRAM